MFNEHELQVPIDNYALHGYATALLVVSWKSIIGFLPFVGFGLQVLISGSADSLDIDDLRQNTNYTGGYNAVSSSLLSAEMPFIK